MDPIPSSPTASTSFQPRSSSMATHSNNTHTEQRPPSPTLVARSSMESSSATKLTMGRSDSLSQGDQDVEVASNTFDENAIRVLLEMDCGVNCMLDRIKQGMASAREAAVFLQKRAALEGNLGRSMHKLAVATTSAYVANDCKAGTFATAWENAMRLHEVIAENRLKLSAQLEEMGEELSTLAKEVDKNRKQVKDTHSGYERILLESEAMIEKAKAQYSKVQDELERFLVAKEGESLKEARMQVPTAGGSGKRSAMGIGKAVAKGGMLLKGKNPRQEDDVRARLSAASDAYRKIVLDTQTLRQEYFNFQLPRTLRALKELSDEIDTAMQFHLSRYAYLLESSLLSDAVTLVPKTPEDGPGLKSIMESIDNRTDFKSYVQNYRVAHHGSGAGPRREGPADQGYLPPLAPYTDRTLRSDGHGYPSPQSVGSARLHGDRGTTTFGVDLVEQMERDGVEVPKILVKCCEAIEKYGIDQQGIYRVNGTHVKVLKLKELMDRDIDSVDLDADEWVNDINNISSVLKMWLRELPEPLMTQGLQPGFIEAAKNENERLRQIRLHERVNDLPDANYSTLKYLMGHMFKIMEHEQLNSMTSHNLAIVFGPTLFGTPAVPMPHMTNGHGNINGAHQPNTGSPMIGDMGAQNKAIETILEHYKDIFVEE